MAQSHTRTHCQSFQSDGEMAPPNAVWKLIGPDEERGKFTYTHIVAS